MNSALQQKLDSCIADFIKLYSNYVKTSNSEEEYLTAVIAAMAFNEIVIGALKNRLSIDMPDDQIKLMVAQLESRAAVVASSIFNKISEHKTSDDKPKYKTNLN